MVVKEAVICSIEAENSFKNRSKLTSKIGFKRSKEAVKNENSKLGQNEKKKKKNCFSSRRRNR